MTSTAITKLLTLSFFCCLSSSGHAAPIEGAENYQISRGKNASRWLIHYNFSQNDPEWGPNITRFDWDLSYRNGSHNYLSMGVMTAIARPESHRDAYFLRYDLGIGSTSSLALKWIHQNLYSLQSGKESLGFDYNTHFSLSSSSQIFLAFGFYYRWLKQRWDPSPFDPTQLQTNDQEGYIQGALGLILFLSQRHHGILDINNRDRYSYYHGDNLAVDFTYEISFGTSSKILWSLGTRMTSLLAGTAYPAEVYSGLGFSHGL